MSSEPPFSDPRFSREYVVPAGTLHGISKPFKISYADYGYRNEANPDDESVFLFFPPLLGSRWMHMAKDDIAKRHKVRIINVERPGYGGTDEVALKNRMRVWQDAIPALLAHLGIKHVSVGCHSAGTVYALDFIWHHPELLHPERPYLAVAGPWIPPSQTGVISMRVVQSLPAAVINSTPAMSRFISNSITPAIGAGTSAISSLFSFASSKPAAPAPPAQDDGDGSTASVETDAKREVRWRPILIEKAHSGNMQGMGEDAVLMMQKAPGVAGDALAAGWGDWGDYEAYVPRLAEALQKAGRKLEVDVFYAETDGMVGDYGDQGTTWFDSCWRKEQCGDVITYESTCVEGVDHDRVWHIKYGVPDRVFGKIGRKPAKASL